MENSLDFEIQAGLNAGGLENEEWTRFNFENYRLGGVSGVALQSDLALRENLYLKLVFNPALGSSIPAWNGINASQTDYPDILAALSWRSGGWWSEIYWDSSANTDAELRGNSLSVAGIGTFWRRDMGRGFAIKAIERLEYGFAYKENSEDHLRYMLAAGLQAPLLKGFETNISFNGFFIDRTEMNIGWDSELMVTGNLGLILALGGIKLGTDDPDFVYEGGISGHFSYLSLYFGYSDHRGGNEGWFSEAFDSTRDSGGGLFLRLDIQY